MTEPVCTLVPPKRPVLRTFGKRDAVFTRDRRGAAQVLLGEMGVCSRYLGDPDRPGISFGVLFPE